MIKCLTIFCFTLFCFMSSDALSNEQDPYSEKRERMVLEQIQKRGVKDERVLSAMLKVKRHLFVPEASVNSAYEDHPLSIGHDQTISQPFIVAYMTDLLDLKEQDKVLEIGTGSGYQAAVLAELVQQVYSIEIVEELALQSQERLKVLGYNNVEVKHGDGFLGWPEKAPFDAIIVTAAPKELPQKLIDQLKEGGRMVVPVGSFSQELFIIKKEKDGYSKRSVLPVRFVPMVHGTETR